MRLSPNQSARRLVPEEGATRQPIRLLVTGGTRFVGAHLADAALASTFGVERLVVLDNLSHPETPGRLRKVSRDPRYRLVQGDTSDKELVKRVLEAHEINSVVNVAENLQMPRASEEAVSPIGHLGNGESAGGHVHLLGGVADAKKERLSISEWFCLGRPRNH